MEVPIANYNLASNKTQAREMMEQALVAVGLRPEETLGRFPHQLSGGQRQRMVVARALADEAQSCSSPTNRSRWWTRPCAPRSWRASRAKRGLWASPSSTSPTT